MNRPDANTFEWLSSNTIDRYNQKVNQIAYFNAVLITACKVVHTFWSSPIVGAVLAIGGAVVYGG